jgi:hypothetical protein
MPQLIINIPTQEAGLRVVNALTVLYNYAGEDTQPAKTEFVRQRIIAWLRDKVKEYEIRLAEQQAGGTLPPDIE